MKKLLGCLAFAGLCVASANAGGRFYFSTEGVDRESYDGTPGGSLTNYPVVGNPSLAGPGRLYLWLEGNRDQNGPASQTWAGLGLQVRTTGTATITNWRMMDYRYDDGLDTWQRWNGVAQGSHDLTGTPAGTNDAIKSINFVAAGAPAVGANNALGSNTFDLHFTGAYPGGLAGGAGTRDRTLPEAWLLGWVELGGVGDVYLGVGQARIARAGVSTNEWVAFGGGDDYAFNRPGDSWADNASRDANIVPEPASLLLIGLAGLALRRR